MTEPECVECYKTAKDSEWGDELIRSAKSKDYYCGKCMETEELNTCDNCGIVEYSQQLLWDMDLEEEHLDFHKSLTKAFEHSPLDKEKHFVWCALCYECVEKLGGKW